MRNAPVAAVPASPPNGNCVFCGRPPEEGFLSLHVCRLCGKPQPVLDSGAGGEDYFALFGLRPRFRLDLKDLEQRFYRLSRALHPDRYTTAGSDARRISLERMSLVNEAYQTLKNPDALRGYRLKLAGISGTKPKGEMNQKIPLELAESWFELQDALADDPAGANGRIEQFGAELAGLKRQKREEIARLEAELDAQAETSSGDLRSGLERLFDLSQGLNYLDSMERDTARLRARNE
jgi:molecular chaperone HscB